jgi:hypothetical protein
MDRGTAFHVFAERAVKLMIEQEEERIPPELAKELMAEVLRERGDLTVPVEEQDRLRQMAYHFAEGVWIDPARVIAVERKFVLPVGDWQVSGKVDFASMSEDGQTAEVWDWKTSFAMASYDDLATTMPDGRRAAKAFQLLLYVLLLAYGYPEAKGETCDACEGSGRFYSPDVGGERNPDCATCEGRGYFATLDPPLGEHVQVFQGFELYPQYLFDDGIGKRGPLTVTRPELMDHMAWLEGLVEKLAGKLESWDFPAVPGSHCTECPARAECPLPSPPARPRRRDQLSRAGERGRGAGRAGRAGSARPQEGAPQLGRLRRADPLRNGQGLRLHRAGVTLDRPRGAAGRGRAGGPVRGSVRVRGPRQGLPLDPLPLAQADAGRARGGAGARGAERGRALGHGGSVLMQASSPSSTATVAGCPTSSGSARAGAKGCSRGPGSSLT